MALPVSVTRVQLIMLNSLRDAVRQRLVLFLSALGIVFVLGAIQLRDFNFGTSELKFIADFGFGAIGFFGAVLAITGTANLFFGEIEQRTIQTLLAKPVSRGDYVLGKFLAVVVILIAFCAVLTALLAAVIWTRESKIIHLIAGDRGVSGSFDYASFGLLAFGLWLKLVVLAAFTLLISTFARTQLFATTIGFLLLVICHLRSFAEMAAARGSVVVRVATRMALAVFPDFQAFDFPNATSADWSMTWPHLGAVGLYGLGYAAAACFLAMMTFRVREL